MPSYKVKAKVLIDIETEFDFADGDEDAPTADTIKFCVDEDIAEEMNIVGAVNDCKVIEFYCEKISN